jgi:hypothetical protein
MLVWHVLVLVQQKLCCTTRTKKFSVAIFFVKKP